MNIAIIIILSPHFKNIEHCLLYVIIVQSNCKLGHLYVAVFVRLVQQIICTPFCYYSLQYTKQLQIPVFAKLLIFKDTYMVQQMMFQCSIGCYKIAFFYSQAKPYAVTEFHEVHTTCTYVGTAIIHNLCQHYVHKHILQIQNLIQTCRVNAAPLCVCNSSSYYTHEIQLLRIIM